MLPPQIDMAKQLGMRPIIEDTFHTICWCPMTCSQGSDQLPQGARSRRKALQADLPKYLPLWKMSVPPEFQDRDWNYSKFTRGERFVYESIPKAEFDEVMQQVERWGLDQHLKERGFEKTHSLRRLTATNPKIQHRDQNGASHQLRRADTIKDEACWPNSTVAAGKERRGQKASHSGPRAGGLLVIRQHLA